MRFSLALLTKILDTGLNTAFVSPVLEVRSGAQPEAAEQVSSGNLLCLVTMPSTNYFNPAADGIKGLAGSWSGTVQSSGVASWFRIRNGTDTGGVSTTLPRIDGSIGVSNADMLVDSVSLTIQDTFDVSSLYLSAEQAGIIIRSTGTFS